MKIYKLKADSKLPHHYFIAVAVRSMKSAEPGKMYLKYKPFYFNHEQIEKFRDVALLTQDRLFLTTQKEALKMHGLDGIAKTFAAFKLAASVNLCSIHHFSSEYEIEEKWFKSFVKNANHSKSIKEKLLGAKI